MNALRNCATSLAPCTPFVRGTPLRTRSEGAAIFRKLRHAGEQVTHKRVERLYPEAKLQGRRRRHKKIPLAGRQPLVRLQAPNAVWPVQLAGC